MTKHKRYKAMTKHKKGMSELLSELRQLDFIYEHSKKKSAQLLEALNKSTKLMSRTLQEISSLERRQRDEK
jgi:hypothetical protein